MPIHLINPGGIASEETRGTGTTNNTYTLVYTFDPAYTVTSIDSASVKVNGNSAGTATATPTSPASSVMNVTLTGIATAQHLAITVSGIHASTSNGAVTLTSILPMDVLVGDVNQSHHVDSGDVGQVQRANSQTPTSVNFRLDVNASGHIDAGDVGVVQRANSTGL